MLVVSRKMIVYCGICQEAASIMKARDIEYTQSEKGAKSE